jgi:hypothetical protein
MTKAIVITSINPPTQAILEFSVKNEYNLYVVGDKKTPTDWNCPNVNFISLGQQEDSTYSLSKVLPTNHYCRKMFGYLEAIKDKADFICDTDDDNIPYSNWSFPNFYGDYDCVDDNKGFINIYQLFSKQKVWPRGLPLKLINTSFELEKSLSKESVNIGIWQGLADEDPDVDAIYRLTNDKAVFFDKRDPIVLGKNTISPFNTQNTLIRKELFPLLYLPTYVTFRYTDILRGLIAQPIMWMAGFQLGFTEATVIQKRNPHDYMKDFISEIPMYETSEKVVEIVLNCVSSNESIENNLHNSYADLLKYNIIESNEIVTLEAWLNDLKKIL